MPFFDISSISPTLLRKPDSPFTLISGRPPALVEITGTLQAMASSAERPKLSVCDGSRKRSVILSIADLFLLPSQTESFGLSALEAMACSVPVISTNAGGLPEINVNGESGFLSNVGDIDDMSKNGIYILANDDRLQQFKQGAIAQAQ